MAYIIIKVHAPNVSVTDMNGKLADNTNPSDGMSQLENLMTAVNGRSVSATVDVVVRNSDQSISAADGGSSATYDKN